MRTNQSSATPEGSADATLRQHVATRKEHHRMIMFEYKMRNLLKQYNVGWPTPSGSKEKMVWVRIAPGVRHPRLLQMTPPGSRKIGWCAAYRG